MASTWGDRKHFGYYVLVNAWLDRISWQAGGGSLLDVGARDTPVAAWGSFTRRYAIDREPFKAPPCVIAYQADFLTWQPPEYMTTVTCLQVLEHLPNGVVEQFATKLRSVAHHTIVSVPYMWKRGTDPSHVQDPIDATTLNRWMGGPPYEQVIVLDQRHLRLVARWVKHT